MKSTILALFSMFVLFSCKKQEKLEQLSEFTKEVLSQTDENLLKHGYALMSIGEREALWEVKLNTILKNDAQKLTKEQRQIVVLVKDFLNENGMDKIFANPALGQDFLDRNLDLFTKHFTNEQVYSLIESPSYNDEYSLMSYSTLDDEEEEPGDGGTKNCTCYYSISCGAGKTCNDGELWKCTKVIGCGMFGGSNCTGLCA